MTTVLLESIRDWLDAPPITQRRFGADSVIDWDVSGGDRIGLGVQYEAPSVTDVALATTLDDCLGGDGDDPTVDQCVTYAEAAGAALAGLYTDSIGSRRPIAEHIRMARERFLLVEQGGIDRLVGEAATAAARAVTVSGNSVSIIEGLLTTIGALEMAFTDQTETHDECERTILMSIGQAAMLGEHLTVQGGVLRTILGSKVAALSAGLGGKIIVTSAIKGARGELDIDRATPDLAVNSTSVLAQRPYTVGVALAVSATPVAPA